MVPATVFAVVQRSMIVYSVVATQHPCRIIADAGNSTRRIHMLFYTFGNRFALTIFLYLVTNTPAWS